MAVARPFGDDFVSFPLFGPWGRWYPWYGSGFGWGYGFVTYNPWRYGATRWAWGRYGLWYDPYSYYWDPYWGAPGYYAPYSSGRSEREENRMGSLRIKANVSSARVYIDDALVGTVDEFDGLRDHLDLESGTYELELRADGYDTHRSQVEVVAGKTQTIRASLKQKK